MLFRRVLASLLLSTTALASSPSWAVVQGTSGGINLRGNMPLSCAISVVDLNATWNLTSGESSKTIGTVTETCNSGSGYSISLASANSGALKSGNQTISYAVAYDNQGGNLTSAMVVDRATAQFGKSSEVKVTVPGSSQYVAGDYADTITITIAAK